MYSIRGYGKMIADTVRFEAHTRALRQAVTPGCTVLDIGAGTGIFAMLACRFGAGKVYAIEPDDSIHVARALAVANGCADKIEFIQDFSTRVDLPAPADVIITDMRGILPLWGHHLPSIADARRRLLAPGGVLIPQRDTLWAAVVEAGELYQGALSGYGSSVEGLEMDAARRMVTNSWSKARLQPDQLLTTPQQWAALDYTTLVEADVAADVEWPVTRAGTAHGLCLWFDATLADGIGFSNAPDAPETLYGSAFFPLADPVSVCKDDRVCCSLRADLVGDNYIWRWETRVLDQGRADSVKASMKQSTLSGVPLPLAALRKRSDSFVPKLREDGRIDGFILSLMDGENRAPIGEIARRVSERFPERFPSWKQALSRVGDLSQRYSV